MKTGTGQIWLVQRRGGWHGHVEYPNGEYSNSHGPFEGKTQAAAEISKAEGCQIVLPVAREIPLR